MRYHLHLPRPGSRSGGATAPRRRPVATAIVTTLAAGLLLLGTAAAENTGGTAPGISDSLYQAAPPAVAAYFPTRRPHWAAPNDHAGGE